MARSWPFAGRAAQLSEIRSAARGLVVVGPPGVGKSRLVAQAVREAEGVAWVRATAAAAELPLGAFAALLPSTPPSGNPLGWAADAVRAPVLVVDDAHLLDGASAALVHHLVTRGRTRVIATLRTETPVPDAVRALWKEDLLPRMELAPLTAQESAAILERALGGTVEQSAVTRLWQASRGNVLYLRELVLSGVLTESGGVWRWRGPLAITPSLRDTIAGRIGGLTPDEREVLEYLAYGEPLGADLLSELAASAAVERLEERQLVTVDFEGRRLQVRLAHPLYGEVIRHGCGTLRARKLLRRLADTVTATGLRRREDVVRVAVWRLDSGPVAEPGLLLAACDRARMVRDLELAERLARAAADAGGGLPAAMALGTVLFYADRYRESEEVFAAAWGLEMDDYSRTTCGVYRAFNLCWARRGRAGAGAAGGDRALGLRARRAAGGAGHQGLDRGVRRGSGQGRGHAPLDDDDGTLRRAPQRQGVRHHGGHHPGREGARHGESGGGRPHRGRARQCGPRAAEPAGRAARRRHPGRAVPGRSRHRRAPRRPGAQARRRVRRVGTGGRRVRHLPGEGAQAEGTRRRRPVRRPRGGRPAALARRVGGVLPGRARPGARPARSARRGRGGAGQSRGHRAAARASRGRPLRQAMAWTLAARGDVAGAIAALLALADQALPVQTPFLLHDVVRLGRPSLVASRIIGEGPLVALFARHAGAGTGAELDAVSLEFERLGLILHAAEAAAQAARRYRDRGMTRAAQAARTRAWALSRRCQGARTPALLDLDVPELTPRQREIALLAAQGLTNREIAERLVVSIRTVANTLYAVYEKTGVSDRTALADLLLG
ncbi:LuxR C-terminal-related transcriptional regulator [Nonomuraea dietziae]|uniref:LuxR C-terminal-related transcriptional regulator n=1 Tax=Nonomuraea dietziae TaxID=65515 RepID=UPI003623C148